MNEFQCISAPLSPGVDLSGAVKIEVLDHVAGVAQLCAGFPIGPNDWPDGYGVSNEFVTMSTHQGTHIDAPRHYGPKGSTIAEADISHFMGKAVIFTDLTEGADEIKVDFTDYCLKLERFASDANAVFFITGAHRRYGAESYFLDFKGIPKHCIEAALDRGYRLIGTDAFSVDPPFAAMAQTYMRTQDPEALWPAHVLGRRRPYYQIERLYALDDFEGADLIEYIALPINLPCGAAWTRAVARRLA